MTYTELLTHLIQNSLVVHFTLKPLQPPYPKNYDSNAKCDYPVGTIGHTTKRCWGLKHKGTSMNVIEKNGPIGEAKS
ncbi:hypothetical protein CR513_16358, partial [Mucuna pruriens]